MKIKLVLGLTILLVGCVSQPIKVDAEMKAYVRCTDAKSAQFARQPGDPISLAMAAEGSCPAEKVALIKDIERQRGVDQTAAIIASMEKSNIEANAATIVRVRSRLN